jgi:hypothetical protein
MKFCSFRFILTGTFMSYLLALVLLSPSISFAAPAPMTTSSIFFQLQKELFYSPVGYSVSAGNTKWVRAQITKNNPHIEAIYRPEIDSNKQAALTIRTDKAGPHKNISQYVKKWLKDYPRFGFQVLESKKVKVGTNIGYLLDLVSNETQVQMRQVLFHRGTHVITFTCRDDKTNFSQTLKSCNEIIKSYK